jgi:hypothetical protein
MHSKLHRAKSLYRACCPESRYSTDKETVVAISAVLVASPRPNIPLAQWLRLSLSDASVALAQPRLLHGRGSVTVSSQRLALVRRCAMAAPYHLCHGYNVYTARCAHPLAPVKFLRPAAQQADGPRWALIRYVCFTGRRAGCYKWWNRRGLRSAPSLGEYTVAGVLFARTHTRAHSSRQPCEHFC